MARKSRKNAEAAASAASAEEIKKPFRAGIYARISLETEETKERGTIETQIQLVRDYIADTEDISAEEVYADSDYSGTNFDRPGFSRMMEDIKNGKINCVIVKDLSRLGRNYVETSNYIERVFPFFHVRFIAVTDDFDSFREGTDLTVPLKNIINEFYARDIAKKSCSAKIALWESGKFVGPYAPYGYKKSDEEHHRQLIIDKESAGHVRDMYQWFLDGVTYNEIARRLNAEGVLTPRLQRQYDQTGEKPEAAMNPWNGYTVKDVLVNRFNIGDSVYGRYRHSKFENGGKQKSIPESDWQIKEGTHEPIVAPEIYWAARKKIEQDNEAFKKRFRSNCGDFRALNFYTGKIFCGGCGNRMVLAGNLKNPTYHCGANMNHKAPGKECPAHAAKKEDVDDEVLRLIRLHMKAALDMEGMIRKINSSVKNQTKYELLKKEASRLRRELTRINQRKGSLYEDYCGRMITEEEYLRFTRIYTEELTRLKEQLDQTLKEQVKYSKDYHLEDMQKGWGQAVHTYMAKRKLTREMADAFVESITIHGRYDYEIKLTYDDLFEDLKKLGAEKEAEKE